MTFECDRDYETVLAFKVHGDYHHVADDWDAAKRVVIISAEQCDDCGCCGYVVQGRYVVCHGDDIDGEVIKGCGQMYPISEQLAGNVVF